MLEGKSGSETMSCHCFLDNVTSANQVRIENIDGSLVDLKRVAPSTKQQHFLAAG